MHEYLLTNLYLNCIWLKKYLCFWFLPVTEFNFFPKKYFLSECVNNLSEF